jgi:Zn2+/Cd2+-exporting ATPase
MPNNQTFIVEGMDCADCARTVENGVRRLEGVQEVSVDFVTGKLRVDGAVSADLLRQRVEALGYKIADQSVGTHSRAPLQNNPHVLVNFWRYLLRAKETPLAVIGGGIIITGLVASLLGLSADLTNIIYITAMLVALYPIARSGLNNLIINRDFNINLLMTIAALGAMIIGETLEGATVIFLFAIGESLEGYSVDRARNSLRSLMELAPATAIRLTMGILEETVPVEQLQLGDTILVKPGERIPMDGVVISGESGVNQSPITGESMPVWKSSNAEVFAGSINGGGALQIQITRLAEDNTLSRIIKMVEEAQSVRAPSQRLIDQFARYYTPGVVVAAAIVATIPPLVFNAPFYNLPDGTQGWFYRALELLVIACPCALVISTPVTIISAITAAARRGVLIKGGVHLEMLGHVKTFAFDKTGTLTQGKPVVTLARSVDCNSGEICAACDDVLALASAVERRSAHPLAQAVVNAAHSRGLDAVYAPAEAVESLAGRGVQGRIGDRLVTVGSHGLFESEHPHSPDLCRMIENAEAQGQTTMLLCDGNRVRGFIAAADEAREDSRKVIADLKALGIETVMLTGDNAAVAQAIGQAVGVDDVRASLLPADKVGAVKNLMQTRGAVGMVGDGVNDTPALAAASVGIAMGAAGSAQALETADIALMADDLRQLPFAVGLSRFAQRLIIQNITLSLGLKAAFIVLALLGGASMWLAILADVGMSLAVTLNGMRPLRFENHQ